MRGDWNTCEMQRKYKSNDKSLEIITKVIVDDESAKEEIMKAI